MIIVAVYDEDIDSFIRPLGDEASRYVDWEDVGAASYIVDPNDILG